MFDCVFSYKKRSVGSFLLALLLFSCVSFASPLCPLPEQPGPIDGVPSGCFDYYVLTLSWNPQFCTTRSQYHCSDLEGKYTATHLGLHGLWPNYRVSPTAYPVHCTGGIGAQTFSKSRLSQETWQQYTVLVPLNPESLASHEWEKHGTCTDLTQEKYFKAMIEKTMHLGTPVAFQEAIGKSMSYEALINSFGGASKVGIMCNYDRSDGKYYFAELSTFWSKDLSEQKNTPLEFNSNCPKDKPIYIRAVPE